VGYVVMPAELLETKLNLPLLRPELVTRYDLIERLEKGINAGHRLTLVSAPAGYGKTTLIQQWLAKLNVTPIWLNLDKGDNDPVRFVTYICTALQKVNPQAEQFLLNSIGINQIPPVERVGTALVQRFTQIPAPGLLIYDDYHTINNLYLHELTYFLLNHLPKHFHLVIISREDPPLALARLRANQLLTEIRLRDLEFSPEEAGQYFADTMKLDLSPDAIDTLLKRTEGWITGLQLAAISLQGRKEIDSFIHSFSGSHRYIIDYLAEEVLQKLPPEFKDFLQQTAILEKLCAPLCDALTGKNNSKYILKHLEKTNLFLIALDEWNIWYRYHHLFADYLQTELSEAELKNLHHKAALWFEEKGYLDNAVHHIIETGDVKEIERVIRHAVGEVRLKGEAVTIIAWLGVVPENIISASTELSILKGWSMFLSGQLAKTLEWIAQIESNLPATIPHVTLGRLNVLKTYIAGATNEELQEIYALKAIELLNGDDLFMRNMALTQLSEAYNRKGNTIAAIKTLREVIELSHQLGQPFVAYTAGAELTFNLLKHGQLQEAEYLCNTALEQSKLWKESHQALLGLIYIPLGIVAYEKNQLEPAIKYLSDGINLCRRFMFRNLIFGEGEWALAKAYMAKGDTEKAFSVIRETRYIAAEQKQSRIEGLMIALEADLQLRLNNLQTAIETFKPLHFNPAITANLNRERVSLVYVRLLLAQKKGEEALSVLDRLAEKAHQDERNGRLITIYLLKVQGYLLKNEKLQALAQFEKAVQLANSQLFLRMFLDDSPVLSLLPLDNILASGELIKEIKAQQNGRDISKHYLTIPDSPETLSTREVEILRLIAAGLSNEDIAKYLVITLGTTKWHITHIYGKLGISSRTQALNRAHELGIV
jgi:LuxR family maltose regulon positive regulatory protein